MVGFGSGINIPDLQHCVKLTHSKKSCKICTGTVLSAKYAASQIFKTFNIKLSERSLSSYRYASPDDSKVGLVGGQTQHNQVSISSA
jgi:hypothetical protein